MKMLSMHKSVSITMTRLHWIFYTFWIIPIIINPETWFFGEKFSGYEAVTIHLTIGLAGMVTGYMIYKNNKSSYFAGFGRKPS